MKSISLILNVILLFLVFYFGCKEKIGITEETPKSSSVYCNDCDTDGSVANSGMISFATAKFLSEYYYADSGKRYIYQGADNTHIPDARNIWFSLKVLKNFIALIETSACKAGCDEEKGLGVRIYYGKYPKKEDFRFFPDLADVPDSFANRHTIFMMPTYHDAKLKKEIDFDPRDVGASCVFKPLNKNLPWFKNVYGISSLNTSAMAKQQKAQYPVQDSATYSVLGGQFYSVQYTSSSGSSEQQNHGGLTPPPDSEGEFPTALTLTP